MTSPKRKPLLPKAARASSSSVKRAQHLEDQAANERKQTTVRLSQRVQDGLALVQQTLGGTFNQHMNEGMSRYIGEMLSSVDRDLTESLGRIRRYRQKDPTFAKAFAQVAADEVAGRGDDPAEGVVFREDVGPSQKKVRQLISGSPIRHG